MFKLTTIHMNNRQEEFTDVQSAKNTLQCIRYIVKMEKVVQDKNYETILDDLLLTIEQRI
jgi:hypothetical protein